MPRWQVYTTAGLLMLAGIACFLAASTEWGDRAAMVDPIPAEAAEQAGFVLVMCAMGALNVAAALPFVLFRWRATWWVVVGMQVAMFLVALVVSAFTDPQGWIAFSVLPLATLLLLVAVRFVGPKLRPSMAAKWNPN